MNTFEATLEQLPKPILDKLRSLIGRVRRLLFVRGLFATIAVALLCLLGIMAIDATVTLFTSAARWGLSLGALTVTLLAGWWFLVRPLSRKLTLTQVARVLEVRHPELQERISTAVELLSSNDPEEVKGSEELIRAVVDSAIIDVEQVDPRKEFKAGRAAKFVSVALASSALLGLILLLFPSQGWVLLTRAVAPFLNIGNAYADTMVVKPGNLRIAQGSEVTIEMTVRHDRLRRAELRRRLPDGTDSIERMVHMGKTDDGAQRFSYTLPSVSENFHYRVFAGAALSEYYQIESVPPPIIEKMKARFDYPSYTGLAPLEQENFSGEVRALAHTRVTVTATVNKEILKAKTVLNNNSELGETQIGGNTVTSSFEVAPNLTGTWRIDLEDIDEFANQKTPWPVQALPDKKPVVRITNPQVRELRLKPVEVLPVRYEITEDYGFSEIAVTASVTGEPSPREIVQPLPDVGGQPGGTWRGMASLNLAALNLQPHQNRLEVKLRARDNRPESFGGPGEGFSDSIIIYIDQGAQSLAEQVITLQKQQLETAIREARNDLERAKNEIQAAERELARNEEVSPQATRNLNQFTENAKQAAERLQAAAENLKDSVFRPQAEKLDQIAKQDIAAAQNKAELIPLTDSKNERTQQARASEEKVRDAIEALKQVEKSLSESENERKDITRLNEMANDQRQLAMEAAREAQKQQEQQQQQPLAANDPLSEEQKRALEEFRNRQEQVQDKLGDVLKSNPEALKQVLSEQQKQANQLAEQAAQLAKGQEQLRKMTSDTANRPQEVNKDKNLQAELMKQLQKAQQEIARETSEVKQSLAESAKNDSSSPNQQQQSQPLQQSQQPSAPPALAKAAEDTQKAAETLAGEKMSEASQSAQEAAQSLAEAARQAERAAQGEPAENNPSPMAANQPQQAQNSQPSDPSQPQMAANQPQAAQPGENTPGQPGETQPQQAQNSQPSDPSQPQMAANQPQAAQQGENNPQQAQGGQPQNGAAEQPKNPAMTAAAEALGDLAKRQEALAGQLAAVESGNLEQALEMLEQQLADESKQLSSQAGAMQQALESLGERQSRYEAGRAENFLNSASAQASRASQSIANAQQAQQQAQAANQAAEGQMAPQARQALNESRSSQQQAQRDLEAAAQGLKNSAAQIAQSLEAVSRQQQQQQRQGQQQPSQLASQEQFSDSFQDVSNAARSQTASEAAERSQQAAQSLQQLAQQAMQQLGNMGQPGQPGQPGQQNRQNRQNQPGQKGEPGQQFAEAGTQPNEGQKNADQSGDGIPPELRELGVTAADWARFKGALTGGSATAIDTDLPAEYRELVGRYFQVIAREANQK